MNETVRKSERIVNPNRHRRSFTLVELLIVVAVILILLGISLRVMSMVNRKAGVARTTWILEQVKNSLGSYYSTYGTYPPVTTVAYQYEKTPVGSLPAIPPNLNYSTGLVFFVYAPPKHAGHNPDPSAQRWQYYLDDIGEYGLAFYSNQVGFSWVFWTNNTHTIKDAWDSELRYECLPPYSRYRLWSVGPNRSNENGAGDDEGVAPGE